jgi:hypothetical protein
MPASRASLGQFDVQGGAEHASDSLQRLEGRIALARFEFADEDRTQVRRDGQLGLRQPTLLAQRSDLLT